MTTPKVYSSPADRTDRRTEFTEFYEAAYSTLVGELLALTGGLDHARAVSAGSFSRAWQAWPAIRLLAEPELWVREDAMIRAYAPPRGMRLLRHGLPPIEPVHLDPEDHVLVAALQRLPMAQRLPLVLHYMAQVPVELIAEWARCAPEQIEAQLDDGFDALVAVLDWPVGADEHTDGEEYDWTAEALQDSARRLPQHITTPPPTVAFRHATAVKLSKQGAPVSVAAAACLGLVVALSLPNQQPEARHAAFTPAPDADPFTGPTLAAAPLDTSVAETAPPPPTSSTPAPKRRPSLASRATPTAPIPVVQVAAAPAPVTSSTPTPALVLTTTTPPATTAAPTTTPTTTPAPATTPSTVTVLVTPSTVPSSTSSASSSATTTTEESEVETTRPRPSPSPGPTTTTSEEPPPSEAETITEELPVMTSADDH